MKYYIGFDIGGTDIKFGLVDETGNVIAKDRTQTPLSDVEIYDVMNRVIRDYEKDYRVEAVGVSVPGIVADDGFMITAGAIGDFYGINLKDTLEAITGKSVFIENDANSAALAEKWNGNAKDYKNSLTVVVGTGIGGGIIVNDELYRGGNFSAGEFGFMIVKPIEAHDTREATYSMVSSVQFGLIESYNDAESMESYNGKEIYELAQRGDQKAQDVIASFYDKLAIGIFNISVTLDPEIILIGGAISTNDAFMDGLRQSVNALKDNHVNMGLVKFPEIKKCRFLNDAGIIGAAYKAKGGMHNV
ncbi:ROK family protein [Erysipelothrix anatis]|uniref:ROK family protein n=1 Tax=Erysipelothrix anatis TaxID=2683713 RepID=UPI00135A0136|nr:ROK family protein [Erysipelothrix anatis]